MVCKGLRGSAGFEFFFYKAVIGVLRLFLRVGTVGFYQGFKGSDDPTIRYLDAAWDSSNVG